MVKPRISRIFLFYTLIIAAYAATVVVAQPAEKLAAANVVFSEGQRIAASGIPDAWKLAEAKFEESFAMFVAAHPPETKTEMIRKFIESVRAYGAREKQSKQFELAFNYLNYALRKAQEAKLRTEIGYVHEELGHTIAFEGKGTSAIANYKAALAIYLELGITLRAATVYRQLGLIAGDEGDYKTSISHLEESFKLEQNPTDRKLRARMLEITGDAYFELNNFKTAEEYYQAAAVHLVALKDVAGTANIKVLIGKTMFFQYRSNDAVKYLLSAITYLESSQDKELLGDALTYLGKSYTTLRSLDQGRKAFNTAAAIFRELKNGEAEANALLNFGVLELNAGILDAAEGHYKEALRLYTQAKSRKGMGLANVSLSEIYGYSSRYEESLKYGEIARKLAEEDGDKDGLCLANRVIGWTYVGLSRYDEAIRYTTKSLTLAEELNDPRRRTDALLNLGVAYSSIGMSEHGIELYKRALGLIPLTNDRFNEATLFNNIGFNYFVTGDLKNAADYLSKAVDKMIPLKMKRELAYATYNLGMALHTMGDLKQARESYEVALEIFLEVRDRRPEASVYLCLGQLYFDQKKLDLAMPYFDKALVLAREIRFAEIEGSTLNLLMLTWRTRANPRLAILYGKQAINLFQSVRGQNRGLQKAELASFVKSYESAYRELADILVSEGRLPEAQQVLDLLKEEEYFDFVRRDSSEARDQAKVAMTVSEKKALDEYSRLSSQLTSFGTRFQTLQDAKNKAGGKLAEAEEVEFQKLKAQIEEAGVGVKAFLSKQVIEFSKTVEDKVVITPESIETLRADLRRIGPEVVLVSTYLLPERYRAIVTTGRTMVDRKVEYKDLKLTAADINRKIAEFTRALQNPRVDPRPLGKELYDIFIKPLENDLRGAGAKTILWSLDGSLRYIPIAALSPDGKTYMAEHYQNVVVTLARQTNLFAKPSADEWRALGDGVSKPHQGFSALPSVIKELDSIVSENGTGGVLRGKKLVDEKFDLDAFRNSLPLQTDDGKVFSVVHLATHFKLGSTDQDSALLLGDGKKLSLFEIGKDESIDFKDVELLALSACETGVSAGDGSGREVESLGMLAQKKGAKAVLATLWKVADEGTSAFMSEFYRIKKMNPAMSKAEAIRLTQKAMIDGKIKSTGTGGACRADDFAQPGKQNDFKCDPNAPFSHPYFWSPFVLIGNWR